MFQGDDKSALWWVRMHCCCMGNVLLIKGGKGHNALSFALLPAGGKPTVDRKKQEAKAATDDGHRVAEAEIDKMVQNLPLLLVEMKSISLGWRPSIDRHSGSCRRPIRRALKLSEPQPPIPYPNPLPTTGRPRTTGRPSRRCSGFDQRPDLAILPDASPSRPPPNTTAAARIDPRGGGVTIVDTVWGIRHGLPSGASTEEPNGKKGGTSRPVHAPNGGVGCVCASGPISWSQRDFRPFDHTLSLPDERARPAGCPGADIGRPAS